MLTKNITFSFAIGTPTMSLRHGRWWMLSVHQRDGLQMWESSSYLYFTPHQGRSRKQSRWISLNSYSTHYRCTIISCHDATFPPPLRRVTLWVLTISSWISSHCWSVWHNLYICYLCRLNTIFVWVLVGIHHPLVLLFQEGQYAHWWFQSIV